MPNRSIFDSKTSVIFERLTKHYSQLSKSETPRWAQTGSTYRVNPHRDHMPDTCHQKVLLCCSMGKLLLSRSFLCTWWNLFIKMSLSKYLSPHHCYKINQTDFRNPNSNIHVVLKMLVSSLGPRSSFHLNKSTWNKRRKESKSHIKMYFLSCASYFGPRSQKFICIDWTE